MVKPVETRRRGEKIMNKRQLEDYQKTFSAFYNEQTSVSMSHHRMHEILGQLHRYETTMHRIAETACMRELTSAEEKRDENTETKVKAIAKELGFEVRFNGDPRGGAIRFVLPSGASNCWDGETWMIAW